MDIVERLVAYKDHTGLTNSQFADKARIPRPTLSQFLNGRNKRLSDDFTSKLHIAYPDLNILWLLFGEGDMLTDINIEISEGKYDETPSLFDGQEVENELNIFESNIEENIPENTTKEIFKTLSNKSAQISNPLISADPTKKIQSIMVFYSDNSYELFTPSAVPTLKQN